MINHKAQMLAGEWYDPLDPTLAAERRAARLLMKAYNDTRDDEEDERKRILSLLIGKAGPNLIIEPPFYCDYGYNITVGENVFFNFNCVVLDVTPVTMGDRVMCAPNVQFYAATHQLSALERRTGLELGKPIVIGSDVWIGGGSIILPGVTIGSRCVIGAGSVVSKDVPDDTLVVGNPARAIRDLRPLHEPQST